MAAFIGNQNAGPRFHAFTAVMIESTSFPEANIPIAAAYKPVVHAIKLRRIRVSSNRTAKKIGK